MLRHLPDFFAIKRRGACQYGKTTAPFLFLLFCGRPQNDKVRANTYYFLFCRRWQNRIHDANTPSDHIVYVHGMIATVIGKNPIFLPMRKQCDKISHCKKIRSDMISYRSFKTLLDFSCTRIISHYHEAISSYFFLYHIISRFHKLTYKSQFYVFMRKFAC